MGQRPRARRRYVPGRPLVLNAEVRSKATFFGHPLAIRFGENAVTNLIFYFTMVTKLRAIAARQQRGHLCTGRQVPSLFRQALSLAGTADKTVKVYAPRASAGNRPVAIAGPSTHAVFHHRV